LSATPLFCGALLAAFMIGSGGCGSASGPQPTPIGGPQVSPPPPPPTPQPTPPPLTDEVALQDYSALPVCTTTGQVSAFGGAAWTIAPSPSFKLFRNGVWSGEQGPNVPGGRGFLYITTPSQLYAVHTNGGVYEWFGNDHWERRSVPAMGCRLPTSPSGTTAVQQDKIIVDTQGGIWIATCSYFKFATYCPDFVGTTIEEGIILRNGVRFPDPGIRSHPEGQNAPWNLKWCGGEMYVHLWPTPGTFGRYQGASNPLNLAPATVTDCG
jgi:hypothetical protein